MEERSFGLRKTAATALLIAAIAVWLSWLYYITLALLRQSVPATWGIFAVFLCGILLFLIPALLLFFPYRDRFSPYRFHVAMWLTISGIYWIFGPLYQYLSINTNRDLVLWYMIPYAWEVPVFGYLFFAPVYHRFRKIREEFERFVRHEAIDSERLRRRIVFLPVFAALYFAFIALAAYGPAGSYQFRVFGGAPWPEIIKNIVTGTAMGFVSGSVVFFLLNRILSPYLERLPAAPGRVPFPLAKKLGAVTVTLVALAFLVYVPVAYKNAQVLFGEHLRWHTGESLTRCVAASRHRDRIPCDGFAIGRNGYFFAVDSVGRVRGVHPQGYTDLDQEQFEPEVVAAILSRASASATSHRLVTRYVSARPIDGTILVSVAHESEFLPSLQSFLESGLLVGVLFSTIFAVLIILFTRGVGRPVALLTTAVRDMQAHRRPKPIALGTGDEMDLLSREFSEMAHELRSYEVGLEKKIAARTAELAAVNKELSEKNAVLERVVQDVKRFDEELRRLNEAKSEFLSMASHQLRTPLTAIKWYAGILTSDGMKSLKPRQRKAFHEMAEANEHMIDLVNALLNVSRIEVGALAVQPKPTRLDRMLKGLLHDVTPLATSHGVRLRASRLPAVTYAVDEQLLGQAVLNLLTNAVKYTPKGGRVLLELSVKGPHLLISVTDTGFGIPDKDKKFIFTKFFRASNMATHDPHGTGLGLYIVKAVIEQMGGTAGFTSEEGKGSTFWIALPRGGVAPHTGTRGLAPMRT